MSENIEMMRFTRTEKWSDPWFSELSLEAKITFLFLCDSVNNAGFLEFNARKIAWETNLTVNQVKEGVIPELTKPRDSGEGIRQSVYLHRDWIWLPNFLKAQKNWPINPKNRAHTQIISLFQDQAIRFFTVARFKEMKGEIDAAVASQEEMADDELPMATRDQLRNAPKDWRAIKTDCMGKLGSIFSHDDGLRERFEAWWDHRHSLGDPLEVPMWRELQLEASKFTPEVIKNAITYSIANGMKTLNFVMAKKIVATPGGEDKNSGTPVDLAEPDGWESAFKKVFPDATPPNSFWRLPVSRRPKLYAVDAKLEEKVREISKK